MESRRPLPTPGRLQRLADDLAEEGVGFLVEGAHGSVLLEELDYAIRPPVHERRVPSYGAIVGPSRAPEEWVAVTDLQVERLPTSDFGDAQVRRFADGISSWAIRAGAGVEELVVFDRSAGSERDLVILARATGGRVVQRHPGGVVRVVGPDGVARHDLAGWHHEPPLERWLSGIPGCLHDGELTALGQLLDFAVHDLGARNIGAVLVFHPTGELDPRHEQRLPRPPRLSIDRPIDLAPLRHALAQTDGTTVFDRAGTLRLMGVHLVPSRRAEAEVRPRGGTRHTSAWRFSYDEPDAIVVVVSDDGPVTVLREGRALARTVAS